MKSLCEFASLSQINIIAEGIETKEELAKLIDLGVRFGQGYFIQKPNAKLLPIREEVIEVIVDENKRKQSKSLNRITDTFVRKISTPLQTLDANV